MVKQPMALLELVVLTGKGENVPQEPFCSVLWAARCRKASTLLMAWAGMELTCTLLVSLEQSLVVIGLL